jgi:hypothetical protein
MLRESIETAGESINLDGLTDRACTRIEGIPNSEALLRFADAFIGEDAEALAQARDALATEMGPEAMVDANGVASNFQRMVRIADSTGIPSEAPMLVMAEDLLDTLDMNDYVSAANSENPSWITRLIVKFAAIPQFRKMIEKQSS